MVLRGWAMPWTRMDGDGARVRALPICATSLCFGSGQAISFPNPNHGGSLPYLCGCSHECPGRRQPGAGEQESSTEAPPKKK